MFQEIRGTAGAQADQIGSVIGHIREPYPKFFSFLFFQFFFKKSFC